MGIAALALLVALPNGARAASATSTIRSESSISESSKTAKKDRENYLSSMKTKQAELKKELVDLRKEKKQKLQQEARTRVQQRIFKIYSLFNQKLARLQRADTKITAKLNQAKAAGIDVSAILPLQQSAQETLQTAKLSVEAGRTLALQQVATSSSKEILKDLIKNSEKSIKSAAESYKKVAEALEPLKLDTVAPQGQSLPARAATSSLSASSSKK